MYQEILTFLSKRCYWLLILIFIICFFCILGLYLKHERIVSTSTSTKSNLNRNICFYPIQVDIRSYRLNKLYKLETVLHGNRKQMKTLVVAKGYEVRW